MFARNQNILGAKGSFYPHESLWHDKNALERFRYENCECGDEPPPIYEHTNAGPSVNLHKVINAYITSYHNADPENFPRHYFPFMAYVYVTDPLYEVNLKAGEEDDTGWYIVPDLWHDKFWTDVIERAFLVLSDGVEIEDRWSYSNVPIDGPYVSFHGGPDENEPVLVVPGHWRCHAPAGLCNYKELVAVSFGYDVPWTWRAPVPEWGHITFQRPWLRALLAQKYDPGVDDPVPPARMVFVETMVELYGEEGEEQWNSAYPDYQIDFWRLADDEEPDPVTKRYLETIDPTGGYGVQENHYRYPDDCFPGDCGDGPPYTFGNWLRLYDDDLGKKLSLRNAKSFTLEMTKRYHEVAIDAVRFFDPNHLIFSECDNWLSGSGEGIYEPDKLIYQVLHSGGEFNTEPGDRISALMTQMYPTIPEEGESYQGTGLISYFSRCKQFVDIQENLLTGGYVTQPFPILIGSFTDNANWEKEWEYNWIYRTGGQTCPIQGVPRVDPNWLMYAPTPHGYDDNGDKYCLDPRMYTGSSTETGLLRG